MFSFSILTNAQSRGIVKRLVTYYDESQGEADKKYVYNRVGDFPIVQLKKTEIKRNLVRSSSVRIAPPNKTIYNRDIRAAIIRSNSIIGGSVPKLQPTKMRAKDDLHQIITNHEPLPIDESVQSAKSVLEALEKNCRKRINNEELTLDRTKRICATETVDSSSREFIPIAQSAKRGRDQSSPSSQSSDSPNSQLKKKFRMKNNALTCSRSSSNLIPFISQTSLPAVKNSLKTFQLSETLKANDEVENAEKRLRETSVSEMKIEKSKPSQEKRLHLFNTKTEKFPMIFRSNDDEDEEFKVNFVKPRAKPVNFEESDAIATIESKKLSAMLSGLSDGCKSPVRENSSDTVDKPLTVVASSSVTASISFTTTTTSSTAAPITTPVSSTLSLSGTTSSTSSLLIPPLKVDSLSSSNKTQLNESISKAPEFQFGAPTTLSSSLSTSVASTKSGRISPLAIFSTPGMLIPTSQPSIDANKSLITFTPVAKPAVQVPSAPLAMTSSISAATSTTALSFGATGTPSFTFGAAKEASKVGTSTTPANILPLIPSAVISKSPSAVMMSPPALNFESTQANSFTFGAKPSVSVAPKSNSVISGISSLSSNSGSLGSAVSFLQKPETTTASGIGFSFSASANSTVANTTSSNNGISFGSTHSGAAPSSFNFGGSTNPAFGNSTTSTFGSSAAPKSTFGQPQTHQAVTASPVFSQSSLMTTSFGQPSSSQAPSFSGFAQPSTVNVQPSGIPLSFGQKIVPTAASATKSSTFSFGSSAVTTASSFSFGQVNSVQPVTTTAPASIFGRLGDKQTETKPAFSFGGSNQQQTNAPSPFGGNSNPPSTPNMFGSISTPAFGHTNNNQPASTNMFGNNPAPNNEFNTSSKPASGGIFSFGGPTNAPAPAPANPSPGIFSFGGGLNTPNNSSQSQNVFGASTPSQNVSASFTFKPSSGTVSTNPGPNVFGQPQSSAALPSYQFGASTANVSFTFGAAAATPQVAPQSSGFNFGGPQSAPPAAGAFNFQHAAPAAPQPSGGLFNIGTGGNQQQRRPIRQAMRRMK